MLLVFLKARSPAAQSAISFKLAVMALSITVKVKMAPRTLARIRREGQQRKVVVAFGEFPVRRLGAQIRSEREVVQRGKELRVED